MVHLVIDLCCTYVDPCLVNNGGCDHFCDKGKCSCCSGLVLDGDGKTCKGVFGCTVQDDLVPPRSHLTVILLVCH